ncbi:MAG: hypothetical protein GX556_09990 [Fibrobacter sp.]|nr:hypothetical protein [Fibrobacter sp.]
MAIVVFDFLFAMDGERFDGPMAFSSLPLKYIGAGILHKIKTDRLKAIALL